jgi:hypothetical protein
MVAEPISAVVEPEKRSNLAWDWRDVPIHDGRAIPGGATLEKHGFTCIRHRTEIAEFDDSMDWAPRYKKEIANLIQRISGASEVILPLRGGPRVGSSKLSGGRGTVGFCHNDYTAASVGRHIAEIDPERAEERLAKRFAIYNVWRLVSPLPQSKPLAVCDATTVAAADLVPGQTHYFDDVYYQNALFRYSPAHRWYYYPDLHKDEVLIWAGFDSDPRFPSIVPHAAFDNPACTDPAAYRINVDCRAFAFFDS